MADEKKGETDTTKRLEHIEGIVSRFLTSHGEIYMGATDDRLQLDANLEASKAQPVADPAPPA